MNMKAENLARIIQAEQVAEEQADLLRRNGWTDNPFDVIYGLLGDAIYGEMEEKTQTYDESVTYRELHSGRKPIEIAERLIGADTYRRSPVFFTPSEIGRMETGYPAKQKTEESHDRHYRCMWKTFGNGDEG